MARVQPKKLSSQEKDSLFGELWNLIASLETRDEAENLFRDLLSDTETVMLARRLRIAKRLLEGKNYAEIQEELQASTGTIAGVHRWLQANEKRYAKALPRLERELTRKTGSESRGNKKDYPQQFSFGWLRKRYPLHFLLFNLLDDPYESN